MLNFNTWNWPSTRVTIQPVETRWLPIPCSNPPASTPSLDSLPIWAHILGSAGSLLCGSVLRYFRADFTRCYNAAMIDRRPLICEHCFNDIVPGTKNCVHCGGELRRLQNWRFRRSLFGWFLCGIGVLIALAA